MSDINNAQDTIDSRDVIERIKELEAIETRDEEEEEELAALKALAEEGALYAPDWEYGETLIRDSYFAEYAEELAEDIGAIDRNAKWPLTCIDWEEAARQLKQDYTSIDFAGVAYWVR